MEKGTVRTFPKTATPSIRPVRTFPKPVTLQINAPTYPNRETLPTGQGTDGPVNLGERQSLAHSLVSVQPSLSGRRYMALRVHSRPVQPPAGSVPA
ncbi:MAG: hypothetical protein QOH57_4317 [Mycobacterium sp.]|jgi:hypothetical protein|nr:hypothetical protein [Mycobacterium sp.]